MSGQKKLTHHQVVPTDYYEEGRIKCTRCNQWVHERLRTCNPCRAAVPQLSEKCIFKKKDI